MRLLKSIDIKKAASWAGSLLMVVSLGFILRRILQTHGDVDFTVFSNPVILAALLSVALLEGTGIVFASLNYRALVKNISGIRVKSPLAVTTYTVSNLYKYIPGGVMYVLGRNKMAIDTDNLSHGKVAFATFIEGALFAIAAGVIAVAFSFEHSASYIRDEVGIPIGFIIIVTTAALTAGFLVYRFRNRIAAFYRNLRNDTRDIRWTVLIKRFACAFVLIFLWAFSFLATLMLLGQNVTFGMGITVMGLYMLSWVAGFLTPGAPSGLGVREVVMLMFMANTLNEGILISAMFMHRMLTVVGDVSAYGMALAYAQVRKRIRNTE
ncbi:MAG: lysylphosphatidylglycerol synthase domain-containing protein [Defluviitaleaceae bacterium]|nr:lysylphosphatidylglycerol synthase domain-containing protein [Defluviitaleaceae bacterium]